MSNPTLTPGVPQLLRWEDDPGWQEAQRAVKEAEASARRKQKEREAWLSSPTAKKALRDREYLIRKAYKKYFAAYLRAKGVSIPAGKIETLMRVYDIGASDGCNSTSWKDESGLRGYLRSLPEI